MTTRSGNYEDHFVNSELMRRIVFPVVEAVLVIQASVDLTSVHCDHEICCGFSDAKAISSSVVDPRRCLPISLTVNIRKRAEIRKVINLVFDQMQLTFGEATT